MKGMGTGTGDMGTVVEGVRTADLNVVVECGVLESNPDADTVLLLLSCRERFLVFRLDCGLVDWESVLNEPKEESGLLMLL